ncbi:MAG: O-antigen ligase family protein [Anaerolineales bacterium]|nr:O-antigen ligase family protein [Anaerolineales bacterium]
MIERLERLLGSRRPVIWAIAGLIVVASAVLGLRASTRVLILLAVIIVALILVGKRQIGLFGLVAVTMIGRFEIGTGTEVRLNAATLLVPALLGLWLIDGLFTHEFRWAASRPNRPLTLFLLAGLLSLLIGNVIWDPAVPRSGRFWIVQLAQWGIFALSAGAFWLLANTFRDETNLQRLVMFYLAIAGSLAMLYVVPGLGVRINLLTTGALGRSPFWVLLAALAGGQLVFNHRLSTGWRAFLVCTLIAVLVYSFYWNRESVSTWGAVLAVGAILAWLRWPRLRWVAVFMVVVLALTGSLLPGVYEFAGGDAEWEESGASRFGLIGRVVEVTMRNPITGLGPAAYRPYSRMRPLQYQGAFWVNPLISAHNNYVDLFSHTGLVGLGLFIWFAVEAMLLGLRVRTRYTEGYTAGYVNGMVAAWAGALLLMLFADWILPFVYNIGFPGFQASVPIWLFLGGLVALEQQPGDDQKTEALDQPKTGSATQPTESATLN